MKSFLIGFSVHAGSMRGAITPVSKNTIPLLFGIGRVKDHGLESFVYISCF